MIGSNVAHSDRPPFLREDYDFYSLLDPELNSTRFYSLLLYAIARANGVKTIVEIGVMYGVTTAFLARAAKLNGGHVHAIEILPENIERATKRLVEHGLTDHVTFYNDDSANVERFAADLVFVDGNHSYESVYVDASWTHHINIGGFIAFHDSADPNVVRALTEQDFGKAAWQCIEFLGDCGLILLRRVA